MSTAAPSSPVTLFGLERSVYTRTARLAAEEKGVAYTLHEVEIFGAEGVPEEHRQRHPFGRIPVLQHGDFVLYETAAITRYVDEAFAGPALQPGDPAQRARMNQVIGVLDAYAYRPMVWGVFVERMRKPAAGEAADETLIASSLKEAAACLDALDGLLGAKPFFAGQALSLADLHAFPMLCYVRLVPEGWAMFSKHAPLVAWYAAMQGRASVVRTTTRYERALARSSG